MGRHPLQKNIHFNKLFNFLKWITPQNIRSGRDEKQLHIFFMYRKIKYFKFSIL